MNYDEYAEKIINIPPVLNLGIRKYGTWFYHPSQYATAVRIEDAVLNNSVIKLPEKVQDTNGDDLTLINFARNLFRYKTNLTDIIFPSSIESIPKGAFSGCKNLRRITIPKSIRIIEEGTFAGCESLTDIYYEGTRQQWEEVKITHARYECEFGGLISGTPVHELTGERYVMIPGNEALFRANIHFRCDIGKLYQKSNTK
jgi:hypothetical protein